MERTQIIAGIDTTGCKPIEIQGPQEIAHQSQHLLSGFFPTVTTLTAQGMMWSSEFVRKMGALPVVAETKKVQIFLINK